MGFVERGGFAKTARVCRSLSSPGLGSTNLLDSTASTSLSRCESETRIGSGSSIAGLPMLPSTVQLPVAAQMHSLGRLSMSDEFVEWALPRKAIESRGPQDTSIVRNIVSPTFHLFGEPCVLKFWPLGRNSTACKRASATNGNPGNARRLGSWATMGLFPKKAGAHLRVRLYIGSRDFPWADSGERDIYSDLFIVHPSQILEAPGERPFAWRSLPDGVLVIGAEVLGNHRGAHLHMRQATGNPPPEPPPPPLPPLLRPE